MAQQSTHKRVVISVQLSPEQHAEIAKLAREDERPVSSYLRYLALCELKRRKQEPAA